MSHPRIRRLVAVFLLASVLLPSALAAADFAEPAAVGIGVTAGNLWFIPVKAISVTMGLTAGSLAYLVFGGDSQMAQQIWKDTTQGPYLITPEVARQAIGERPELARD
ncbi:MAG: hypothetical protein HYV04_20880 [Deltaproteobacteria bacterium]|nr:hypothetical protein [Deltaproteobacteria bacterium]